jgi:hypothetical protein
MPSFHELYMKLLSYFISNAFLGFHFFFRKNKSRQISCSRYESKTNKCIRKYVNLLHFNRCKPPTCFGVLQRLKCNKFKYFHTHLLVLFLWENVSAWS